MGKRGPDTRVEKLTDTNGKGVIRVRRGDVQGGRDMAMSLKPLRLVDGCRDKQIGYPTKGASTVLRWHR